MSTPMPTPLPYGIRDCKLTKYADPLGTQLGTESVDLPNMQTFSFSEAEEFSELRGDDQVVTTHGQGAQIEWELEAGGISLQAWAVLSGGQVIEEGLSPNRRVICRKFSKTTRPFFRLEGQAISDSGGDIHGVAYRCRANDTIEGEFADGEFFVTSCSGVGLPLTEEGFDLLYDWVHNEQPVTIPTTDIAANPTGTPTGLTAATPTGTAPDATVELSWNTVQAASSYTIQRRADGGEWAAASPASSAEGTSVQTGLTAGAWEFRVAAIRDGVQSAWSDTAGPVTVT